MKIKKSEMMDLLDLFKKMSDLSENEIKDKLILESIDRGIHIDVDDIDLIYIYLKREFMKPRIPINLNKGNQKGKKKDEQSELKYFRDNYTVDEFAQALGISTSTLWKLQKENIVKAYRTPQNRKYFTKQQYSDCCTIIEQRRQEAKLKFKQNSKKGGIYATYKFNQPQG